MIFKKEDIKYQLIVPCVSYCFCIVLGVSKFVIFFFMIALINALYLKSTLTILECVEISRYEN